MKKICIIGAFAFDNMATGGQPVKTRTLYYTLCDYYGKDRILYIDTKDWKKHPFKLLFDFFRFSKKSDCLIVLPAQNGLSVFAKLSILVKKAFKVKIFYDVIGGWLPFYLQKNKEINRQLQKFNGIWVETTHMQKSLETLDLKNVSVVPNFKELKTVDLNETDFKIEYPLRFVTFSRVMKEKGIEDAVNAIKTVNEQAGKTICSLDIFGQIDINYTETFEQLQKQFPPYIKYCGCISPNESTAVLKTYFGLLFPTYYEGEGFAGTLIDAMFAGLPAISSDWRYNSEIIQDNVTGMLHKANNVDDLIDKLKKVCNDPQIMLDFKLRWLQESNKYNKNEVTQKIISLLQVE